MLQKAWAKERIMQGSFYRSLTRRRALAALGVAGIGFSLSSCGKSEQAPASATGEEKKLNFFTWADYIGETTLDDFKAATGIEVKMDLFATNDDLFAKMRAGNPGYDVIVPSNEFVTRMIEAKMLMEIDQKKIPNLVNIGPEWRDISYDPGQAHSVPYTWLVIGIGYRKSKVQNIPDSWKYVFDSDEYAGRIAMLSEAADVFRLGFKYLGKSVNDFSPELLKQVEDMLIKQKKNIKVFHDDNGQDLLVSGEVDLVVEYNGDIAQRMQEDQDIDFVVPKEGSLLNTDNLCIPVGAPHPENAHAFINFILDAENDKKITETIQYPTPNLAAKALMDDAYKNSPAVYPSPEVLSRCEYGRFTGAEIAQAFEAAMTRVRAA